MALHRDARKAPPGVRSGSHSSGRALAPAHAELLEALVGAGSPLLPFAEAVVLHLSGPAARGCVEDVILRAGAVLSAAGSEAWRSAADRLTADPELLASFFQNGDRLDTRSEEGRAIVRSVNTALERFTLRIP
jgi:hypothetical protein